MTVLKNLRVLGYDHIGSLAISKTYEFTVNGDREKARKDIKTISEEILTNPVIQEFRIEEE